MSLAHIIALGVIPILIVGSSVAALWSQRIRDAFFFFLVVGLLLSERLDVNFFSEAWYRGTTRGVLVSVFEILAFAILFGCRLGRRDEARRWYWPPSMGLLLLYTFYCCLSVMTATPKMFGGFELTKMAGAILIFSAAAMYLRTRHEWGILIIAMGCSVGAEGIWAVKQKILSGIPRAAGTLDHANSLSTYLCMGAPLLIAAVFADWPKRMRWFCGIAAACGGIGEIMSFSRMGIPLFILLSLATVVMCARPRITRGGIAATMAVLISFVVILGASWNGIKARYAEASFSEEYFDVNVDGRGIYLRLAGMIVKDHFFGVGLNNWSYYVSRDYGRELGFKFADYDYLTQVYGKDQELFADSYLAAPAHNLLALTIGELGIPGLILFALLWMRWFSLALPFLRDPRGDTRRCIAIGLFFSCWGVFGHCVTEWVYRQTPILFTFYILLGALAAVNHHRKEEKKREEEEALAQAEAEARPELQMIGQEV